MQNALLYTPPMKSERFLRKVAVYMLLVKDEQVLLLRRYNTGWMDGYYTLPAGHVDGQERAIDAAVRETKEEVGVAIVRSDIQLMYTVHRYSSDTMEYIDLFFKAEAWQGEPRLMEADKADDVSWFPLNALPEKILDYVRHVIETYPKGEIYFEAGWDKKTQ